jgi:hypothetical protein
MSQKIEKFDRYQKIAEAIGELCGVPVTGDDVRAEMRTKPYNTNVGRDGLLSPTEMARLKRNVRHAVAQRVVDAEFAKAAQQRGAKPIVAKSNPAWFRSQRQDSLIDEALRTKRTVVPMAKLLDRTYQQQQKALAYAEFNRGPMWLRSDSNAV